MSRNCRRGIAQSTQSARASAARNIGPSIIRTPLLHPETGAAGRVAVLAEPERFQGKRVGLILSGGNIDTHVLTSVLQRYFARAGQLVRLTINALDVAGGLDRIATIIGEGGGNILNVNHERVFGRATARATDVALDVELADPGALSVIMAKIQEAGFPVALSPSFD